MKVIFAAGGTGGHIYPAIAVAKEILRRDSAAEIRFVGTKKGLETKLVPENGFALSTIDSLGLKNVGLSGKLKGLFVLPKSFFGARKLLKEFEPDVVVGAGGYVTGPVLLMASFLKIPTLVMDSNALPGFTNRQLARFIDKAALTFDESLKFFSGKGIVTGNPVRKEFFEIEPKKRGEKLNILIFGGSQGARAINLAMIDALKNLPKEQINIVHQTGEVDFSRVEEGYRAAGWQPDIRKYISDMVAEFAKADLVICRAGATTCAELCAAGKASIMIPLPSAADDHQRKNAEALVKARAAKMILQMDLNGQSLANEIVNLAKSPPLIVEMERNVRDLARKDAAVSVADIIGALAGNV